MQFLMHNHAKTGMYWQWNVGLLRVLFLLSIKLSQTGSISNRRVQSILFTGPDNTSDGTKREKRLATCLPYSGGICSKYLDSEKLVYYTESPNVVEKRLSGPFTVIEGRFKDHCKTYALPALCLTSFPYCVSKTDPQPVKLCIDDCNHLYDVVCKHDFNLARRVATRYPPLFKIMPHCENLTKGSNCIELGFDEDNNKSHEVVTSHPNRIYSDLNSSLNEQSSTSPNVSIFPEVKAGINNSSSNVLLKSESPTVVNAKNTSDKVEFQLKEGTTLMQTKSTLNNKPTKVSIIHLQVSIVGDTLIKFPKDTASLYASAWPKENKDHPYSYQWQQISSPEGSHGYMEGKNAQRVVLSQLNKPGIYQLRVVVRSAHYAYGKTFVNITVEQPKRVNKPPRADISPKEQTITLPTNEVVLDGSKSSDDDRIVEYKWQELKGPLTEKNGKIIKSGVDSPVLQLKSLLPGVYTYKLTVTDSDGDTDSTTATVTVNEEKDYPPVARAGNDVVITLPENSVTLYGNGSTDDHGIKSYEWSKSPLSPACDLQGSSGPILHVSNMVGGDYSFTLRVTDSGGQTSDSRVTVVVRPEQNSPPVAKGGDDKDLVFPDDSTTLNAKDSSDDQGIASYKWEKLSGPSSVIMSGVDKMILNLSQLKEGHYVFKLTVTDTKGLTDTDTVSVTVKRDDNKPPTAVAGPDIVVKLPNRAAALDGSSSSDDYGIISYIWSRDLKSPAAGDVINGSDHQAILRLSNLVKGIYQFRLTVRDGKGKESHDDAKIYVKEDENGPNLVELYLDVDVTSFTEENKVEHGGTLSRRRRNIIYEENKVEHGGTLSRRRRNIIYEENKVEHGGTLSRRRRNIIYEENKVEHVELYLDVDVTSFTRKTR
ncbi:dyslexia-associated protein KIAA0319-like protein isoform X3 [Xenia sp. Carnegie-2017]|uniref:dyslexia-associated protein KIAA0319-like protein isoform X2 n=1 Tax=Xenia sp. Carnegie-2017 TaxID=2897299 RepID=UPI001F03C5BD|nr:dyslexia-associated protein KIAA0319-like protein isoform X2 [Xenia sp. Carnegie-2017]XP_046859678.1 dyslexia-associated protein KIAA0319-like protein isoform X3 [Xenia sp. Carnegie-2017]